MTLRSSAEHAEEQLGLPVHQIARGGTTSHQLAIEAQRWSGGQAASKMLRPANILAGGIGLPIAAIDGDVTAFRRQFKSLRFIR